MDMTEHDFATRLKRPNAKAKNAEPAFFAEVVAEGREDFSRYGKAASGTSDANPLESMDSARLAPALQAVREHF